MILRKLYFAAAAVAILGLAISPGIYAYGTLFEGRLNPVTTPASIYFADPIDHRSVRVRMYAHKLRECDFDGIAWYLGRRGELRAAVNVEFGDGARIRHPGLLDLGPWDIALSFRQLWRSHADVYHRCRFLGVRLPWRTRTEFYR